MKRCLLCCSIAFAFAVVAPVAPVLAQASDRYLIIHVDAISFETFERAFAAGLLPNIERIFADGVTRRGLSLYPGSTPVIYPRIRTGEANDGVGPLSIAGWFDREREELVSELAVRYELVASVPRRAVSTFVHGWIAYSFAELSMRNLPALLERYRAVEFLWFATDTIGHLDGTEGQIRSLQRLDAALAEIEPQLDLPTLNLILYSDHGMSDALETVDVAALVDSLIARGDIRHLVSPNLYLNDPSRAASVAARLVSPGAFDFAFYRSGPNRVAGFLDGEAFELELSDGGIAYRSEADPFDYASAGIPQGVPFTAQEWLERTIDHPFPAVVPNLFRYLQNPDAGDVVFGLNPPRIPKGDIPFVAHHYGLRETDLLVPVLARGPDLGRLMSDDPLWLHTLFEGLDVDPHAARPAREEHQLALWFAPQGLQLGLEGRFSPAYRWRVAGELAGAGGALWGEYDLFSDYLIRTWLGVGVAWDDTGAEPLVRVALDFDAGTWQVLPNVMLRGGELEVGVGLRYALGSRWQLGVRSSGAVGVGVRW
jgi:hypothetical protein